MHIFFEKIMKPWTSPKSQSLIFQNFFGNQLARLPRSFHLWFYGGGVKSCLLHDRSWYDFPFTSCLPAGSLHSRHSSPLQLSLSSREIRPVITRPYKAPWKVGAPPGVPSLNTPVKSMWCNQIRQETPDRTEHRTRTGNEMTTFLLA